jgi:SAM-dependent methyltransferase
MISSDEFKSRHRDKSASEKSSQPVALAPIALPDLTMRYADRYSRRADGTTVFKVAADDDFELLHSLIADHRYRDSVAAKSSQLGFDKQMIAAIADGLGARSCLELGCYNGPILSLLADKGIDVCGVETSHLAFVLAYPNIYNRLRFGTLLELDIDRQYDVFLSCNTLEHLSPLGLDKHVERIARLVSQDGFAYINSRMFGADEIFGTAFGQHLPEWRQAGDSSFWRHIHCDSKGWPMHGSLVWAHVHWWEQLFLRHGLVRERELEAAVHGLLGPFFQGIIPARRSFFLLRHIDARPDVSSIRNILESRIMTLVDHLTMQGQVPPT